KVAGGEAAQGFRRMTGGRGDAMTKAGAQRRRRVADARAWRARQKRGAAVYPVEGRDVLLLAAPCLNLLPNSVFQIHETAMAAGAARWRQYFRDAPPFPRRSTAAWRRASRRLVARAAHQD